MKKLFTSTLLIIGLTVTSISVSASPSASSVTHSAVAGYYPPLPSPPLMTAGYYPPLPSPPLR